MATLSDMLGMGIAIQLRNAFSAPAAAITSSSRNLTTALVADSKKVNDSWKFMAAGGALMFLGTGILGGLYKMGDASLNTAAKFQVLRTQIAALTKDEGIADSLFEQAKKFTLTAPFQIDQVTTSLKTLLAFGIQSKDAMKDLALAGNWASLVTMPGGIEKAANIIGRINSGNLGYAMRSAQAFGIPYSDIAKINPAVINPKTRTTAKGVDPQVFLDAFLKAIEAKFGQGMERYMKTLPGMITNVKDQWILMMAEIGAEVLPIIQNSMGGILRVLSRSADLIHPFAIAVGEALGMLARWVIAILTPIGRIVVWIMELAKDRPGIFKLAAGVAFVAGAVLNLAGAALIAVGVFKLLRFLVLSDEAAILGRTLLGLMGPVGWIMAAGFLFYQVWTRNLLGVRDMLTRWYSTVSMVVSGVWTLLKTLSNGSGTMTVGMANALKKAGLFDLVVTIFMWAYRIRAIAIGIGEGFMGLVSVFSYVMAGIIRVFQPIEGLVNVVMHALEYILKLDNSVTTDRWENLGKVIGFLGTAFLIARSASIMWSVAMAVGQVTAVAFAVGGRLIAGIMQAWTVATKVLTGAQWLLSAAMDANPVGVIIMAIAVLIGLLVWAAIRHRELAGWIHTTWMKVPEGARTAISASFSFMTAWTGHWNNIKNIVQSVITWFKNAWEITLNWLLAKLETIMGVLNTPASGLLGKLWTHLQTPVFSMPQMQLAPAHAEAISQPGFLFNQMLNEHRAANQAAKEASQKAETNKPPIQVHSTVRLDGKKVGSAVTTHQQERATGGK